MRAYEIGARVCVCVPSKLLKHMTDFHEILYEYFVTGAHPNAILPTCLQLIIVIYVYE
jgi:hypothetical protein